MPDNDAQNLCAQLRQDQGSSCRISVRNWLTCGTRERGRVDLLHCADTPLLHPCLNQFGPATCQPT
jgi:hypothetical protein